jgi:hypothetical protein
MVPAKWTDLISAGTRFKVPVLDVKLFYTKRTRIVSIIAIEDSI